MIEFNIVGLDVVRTDRALVFYGVKLIGLNFGMFFLFILGLIMILATFKVSCNGSSSQTKKS